MKPHVVAIVPSAGIGKRFSSTIKKNFLVLKDLPVIARTLLRLQESNIIDEIIPVLRQRDEADFIRIIQDKKLGKIKRIAHGGSERQDSVRNALSLIDQAELVLIHDGARPFITCKMIESIFNCIEKVDGVVPGLPLRDTIKEIDGKGFVKFTHDRKNLTAIQTPQVFKFHILKRAYDKAYADGFYGTDDSSLVERIGGKIRVIDGTYFNIKITLPQDAILGEFILQQLEKE